MNKLEINYLRGYFSKLTEQQRISLLVKFFEELKIQEFVNCPSKECLEDDPTRGPYWAHTGDPLI
jgi:hypothetical protein